VAKSLEQLEAEVLDLPISERAHLVQRLIASLDEEESDDPQAVERAWEEEIRSRLAEIETGTAELTPAEEVFAEIRSQMRR
jgi:putative addiction module component (TIGR02574 family)